MEAALKPLNRLVMSAAKANDEACAEYGSERIVFEAQKAAIEARIKKEAAKHPGVCDVADIAAELFEEPVAIYEFDGGLSRDEAERSAWQSVKRKNKLTPGE